jgi:undecaprenyl-diphosphatase
MEIWQAILLGAVQGFAEFLPISSSGHLMLVQRIMGITENAFFYSVVMHLGTLIPVIIVLWKSILNLFTNRFKPMLTLIIASIPAGLVGVMSMAFFDLDELFINYPFLLSITFLITAVLMLVSNILSKKEMVNPINNKTAFIMGLGQGFGVIPGISRSGSTLTAGNIAGVKREENASFTFLMSVPIIVFAVLSEGYKSISEGTILSSDIVPLILGLITSAVCGYIAIKTMLAIIKKANYKYFVVYLVLISIVNLII